MKNCISVSVTKSFVSQAVFLGLSGTLTTSSSLSTTPLGCKWRRKCIRSVSILLQCVCVCVCGCFWLVGCHFSCIGVRLRNIEASRHSARNWKSISLKVRRGNERAENKWKKEVRQRMKRRQGGGNTGDQKIIVWCGGGYGGRLEMENEGDIILKGGA